MATDYKIVVVPDTGGGTRCITICSPLPGNQILISKYLARRGVVVSGGWSNGSGWQQTTKYSCSPRHWGHSMHVVPDTGTTTTIGKQEY